VKILAEAKLDISISSLAGGAPGLEEFLVDRIEYYFREVHGFKYDEVRAVLAAGHDNVADVAARLQAVRDVRPTENFEPLAASFKRIQNILKQAQFTETGEVDLKLLEPGPERELHDAIRTTEQTVRGANYRTALEAIASLRPQVDRFFDKVLVNVKEEAVRRNRLVLLKNLLTGFSTIANFSEIVTEKQE